MSLYSRGPRGTLNHKNMTLIALLFAWMRCSLSRLSTHALPRCIGKQGLELQGAGCVQSKLLSPQRPAIMTWLSDVAANSGLLGATAGALGVAAVLRSALSLLRRTAITALAAMRTGRSQQQPREHQSYPALPSLSPILYPFLGNNGQQAS